MTDVSRLFADLKDVASAINQQSDQLNQRITIIEKSLFDLRLGFTFWMSASLDGTSEDGDHTNLGWTGHGGDWGLYVRTYRQDIDDFVNVHRLRDASREYRLLALKAMPTFLVELKAEAERVLKVLQEANRDGVLRTPLKA